MSEQVLDELLARTDAAGKDWMRGEWSGYSAFIAHDPDVSIYGPFGGVATEGWDAWNAGSQIAIRNFQNGTSASRIVRSYSNDDMVVLVLLEEGRGEIGGLADQDWSLRVTQVYQRRGGEWKVVHRHADPLMRRRNVREAISIASG